VRIIEITVDPKGQTRVETKGFAGPECRAASRFVETALGRATAERLTPEFHRGQPTGLALRQSQGPDR
jgi:hypothetical protein